MLATLLADRRDSGVQQTFAFAWHRSRNASFKLAPSRRAAGVSTDVVVANRQTAGGIPIKAASTPHEVVRLASQASRGAALLAVPSILPLCADT